jgi:hypothetical protein
MGCLPDAAGAGLDGAIRHSRPGAHAPRTAASAKDTTTSTSDAWAFPCTKAV